MKKYWKYKNGNVNVYGLGDSASPRKNAGVRLTRNTSVPEDSTLWAPRKPTPAIMLPMRPRVYVGVMHMDIKTRCCENYNETFGFEKIEFRLANQERP